MSAFVDRGSHRQACRVSQDCAPDPVRQPLALVDVEEGVLAQQGDRRSSASSPLPPFTWSCLTKYNHRALQVSASDEFIDQLPMTLTGKIRRRALRDRKDPQS